MQFLRSISPAYLLWLVFIPSVSQFSALAQQRAEPSISVNALSNRVAIGEIGTLIYKITGGDAPMPKSIEVQGLEVIHSGQQSSIVIRNGVQMIEASHFYRFRGNDAGTFTIPPVEVVLRRSKLVSKPIEVSIFERDGSEAMDATRPFFGKLDLPKTDFYVNELLPFTVTAYVRGRNSINDIVHVKFEHESFVMRTFRDVRTEGDEIGNTYYSSAILPSTLFALKPGSHRLGPAEIGVRTLDAGSGFGFSSFFSRTVVRDLATNTVNVTIKPLPNGAPLSFSGGVGSFELTATPSTTEVSIGDPISMEFIVTGKGNFQTMEAPQFSVTQTDIWKTYEAAKKLDDETDSDGFKPGRVAFSQVIIPEAKVDTIPTFELSYFDPTSAKYVTLKTEPIPISVNADSSSVAPVVERPGSVETGSSYAPSAVKPSPSYDDMLHIRTATPRWIATLDTGAPGFWFYLVQTVFSIAFFTVLAFGATHWWKSRELLAASANASFRDAMKKLPGAGTSRREFYHSISGALSLWKKEHPAAPDDLVEIVDRVSEKCDAVVYSGAGQPEGPVSVDEIDQYHSILKKLPLK